MKQHYHEIIYLKNGTVVKGIILEHLPDQSIKVKTDDQKEPVLYKQEEVDHIVKEFYDIKRKGYVNITELAFAVGSSDVSYGISTVNGFLIKPHFSVGVGVALDNYVNAGMLLPVYADARLTFHDKRFTPFLYGDLGYSFGIFSRDLNQLQGGLFFNPGIGIKSYISKKTALILSGGARVQQVQYNVADPVTSNIESVNTFYTMFVVKVGLRF